MEVEQPHRAPRPAVDTGSFSRRGWKKEESRDAIAFHITMRLAGDRGMVRTPGALRTGSRIVEHQGKKRGLLAHRFADTHLHVVTNGTREDAGQLALYVESSLRKRLGIRIPFESARIRPIHTERHLLNTLRYVFRQEAHHGTAFDEAHDGSSLPDLLGMRTETGWLLERLRIALPRLKRETLLGWLDAPELDAESFDLRHLADAAAATFRIESLVGTSVLHIRARRAAVQFLARVAPHASAVEMLGIASRPAARYRREPVGPDVLRAVERQLKLRTLVGRRAEARLALV